MLAIRYYSPEFSETPPSMTAPEATMEEFLGDTFCTDGMIDGTI